MSGRGGFGGQKDVEVGETLNVDDIATHRGDNKQTNTGRGKTVKILLYKVDRQTFLGKVSALIPLIYCRHIPT